MKTSVNIQQLVLKIDENGIYNWIVIKIDVYRGFRLQIPFFGVTKHFITLRGVYQYLEKHHDLVEPTSKQLDRLVNIQEEPKLCAN